MKSKLRLAALFVLFLASYQSEAQQCSGDNAFWKIGSLGSVKLSDCNPSYNCHGFVMSYFEGNPTCTPSPFSNITPAYSCPVQAIGGIKSAEWKANGGYARVCEEGAANIAYYEGGSAIVGRTLQ